MDERYWETDLSYTSEDGIYLRGYDLIELIGAIPFPSVLGLLYTGELLEPGIAKLIDAVMVASIDHGPGAPSALVARTAVSGGAPLGAAAAAGLLTLGKFHGAAVQDSMEVIERVVALSNDGDAFTVAADRVVAEWRQSGRRVSGFGHRQHKRKDPRIPRLFDLAHQAGVSGRYLAAAQALEGALKQAIGKDVPLNIDGAIAAILLEVGFPPGLANALFMVARIAGILAHAHEEQERMPPMRRIDPIHHGYSGPKLRKLNTRM